MPFSDPGAAVTDLSEHVSDRFVKIRHLHFVEYHRILPERMHIKKDRKNLLPDQIFVEIISPLSLLHILMCVKIE